MKRLLSSCLTRWEVGVSTQRGPSAHQWAVAAPSRSCLQSPGKGVEAGEPRAGSPWWPLTRTNQAPVPVGGAVPPRGCSLPALLPPTCESAAHTDSFQGRDGGGLLNGAGAAVGPAPALTLSR